MISVATLLFVIQINLVTVAQAPGGKVTLNNKGREVVACCVVEAVADTSTKHAQKQNRKHKVVLYKSCRESASGKRRGVKFELYIVQTVMF